MISEPLLKFNARAALGRRNLKDFILYTKPDYSFNWHHDVICQKLDAFARGNIKKLMLFVPPQHGKSELSTRRLPAYVLGIKPKTKIAICSYSDTLATSFNRDIQRIIDDTAYHEIFPDTYLNTSNVVSSSQNDFLRNANIFETVGHRGFVKTVGVGGSLTGTPVDLGIIDDPFKDREEAMSATIRDKVYNWYTDVFSTRLHNDSQQLLIMTRWHQKDLAGQILAIDSNWEVIVFQAIKERDNHGDPRLIGEALWPEKHSLERLELIRTNSPTTFNSLYQQEPKASAETLVFPEWSEISDWPDYGKTYGFDFGFTNDPCALVEVQRHNENLYVRELLYQKGLTNKMIYKAFETLGLLHVKTFADSSEPKSIKELQEGDPETGRSKINMVPAVKGPGSVNAGINMIKDFKLHVHKDSHNLKTELLNYQWETFGGVASNDPIDANNHLCDAMRYACGSFAPKKSSKAKWY